MKCSAMVLVAVMALPMPRNRPMKAMTSRPDKARAKIADRHQR